MGGQPRAPAGGALEADPAAMQFDQGADQRQAKARALEAAVQLALDLHEGFEHPLLVGRRDADASVAPRQLPAIRGPLRSEARPGWKECVSTFRSSCSPY